MVHSSLEVPVPKGKIHLMVVSEEWRPDDGDDLMVLLALNHATRGILPPFGFAPGARREMTPEEIRDWIGAHEDAVLVVVLSASPPTVEERRAMDEAYLRATSPEGMADVREGRAALPERYSDDWLAEVGPKCAAAIEAALAQRRELAILMPAVRLTAIVRPLEDAAMCVEDDTARAALVDSMTFGLRQGDHRFRVPLQALVPGLDGVVAKLFTVMREAQSEPPPDAPDEPPAGAADPASPPSP